MSDSQQPNNLRDVLPADLAVPPTVTVRMLAAIAAEGAPLGGRGAPGVDPAGHGGSITRPDPDHPDAAGDSPDSRSHLLRARNVGWWLGGAAAASLLLIAVLGIAVPQRAAEDSEAPAAAGTTGAPAGSIGQAAEQDITSAEAAAADKAEPTAIQLTAGNIESHVRALVDARPATADQRVLAACAAVAHQVELPSITQRVDLDGRPARLAVFEQLNLLGVWVIAPDCDSAQPQVLLHTNFAAAPAK